MELPLLSRNLLHQQGEQSYFAACGRLVSSELNINTAVRRTFLFVAAVKVGGAG